MIRALIALYAFGLLAYPVWALLSPESYRAGLEDFPQAAAATVAQLQMAAAIHWLKNAYLAFAFLLLARYVGRPTQPSDLRRAAILLMLFPLIAFLHIALSQVAMSPDREDLQLSIHISTDLLIYVAFGLSLLGIARTTLPPGDEPQ